MWFARFVGFRIPYWFAERTLRLRRCSNFGRHVGDEEIDEAADDRSACCVQRWFFDGGQSSLTSKETEIDQVGEVRWKMFELPSLLGLVVIATDRPQYFSATEAD